MGNDLNKILSYVGVFFFQNILFILVIGSRAGYLVSDHNQSIMDQEKRNWSEAINRISEFEDTVSFSQLFDYFAPRVKAYVMKLGASSSVAEDLTQEVFVNVWRKASQFDSTKANASTWIYTIARNLRIDAFRKEKRPMPDPNDPAMVPDPIKTSEDIVFSNERADIIKSVLDELPDDQRKVIQLSFFEDMTHSEIANRLNLPLGTVKSRIRLAFQRIKNSLGEEQ